MNSPIYSPIIRAIPANRKTIKVIYSNGDSQKTEINGTEREIEEYFLNKWFNVGDGKGGDLMVKCIDIKFI